MTDRVPEIVELAGGTQDGRRRPVEPGCRTYLCPKLNTTGVGWWLFVQAFYDDTGRTTPDGLRVFAYRAD